MESQTYIFEAQQDELLIDGQPQIGQSRLLEDNLNCALAYERLHLGEVANGAQAVVYYERGETTGIVTLARTVTTDGLHNWHLRDTQMTAEGSHVLDYEEVTIGTEDSDGFMNRHMFLQPGDTLAMTTPDNAARVKMLGTIMSVHLIDMPQEPLYSIVSAPINPSVVSEFARAV